MLKFTIAIAGMLALCGAPSLLAQTPAPPPDAQRLPADSPPPQVRPASPAPSSPRTACRQKAREKGLRGPEMRDEVAVCIQEARTRCLRQAVDQKVERQKRREFIRGCLGERRP